MPQSSPIMRRILILTALAGWAVGGGVPNAGSAEPTRSLTLRECIELSLKHNLDIQVDRYLPEVALYDLKGRYGAYDPTFTFRGETEHTESGSRTFSGAFELPGTETESQTFSSGLGGLLPWGMTYNLQGNVSDTYGTSFRSENGIILPNPFESSQGSASLVINQHLLRDFWIDSTRLGIRVAKNRLKYSELQLLLRLMQTVTQTEVAYYNLVALREYVQVQEKAVELAERLLQENRKRVEVGAMAPLDEKQAESQTAASRADLLAAQNAVAIQENTLKNLLTAQYSDWADLQIVPAESLKAERQLFNRQDSWSKGLEKRPELLQAKLDLEQAGIQLKYAKNQLLPLVDIFGTFGYNGSGPEFSGALEDIRRRDLPAWSYGGMISFPLANTGARNAYRSNEALLERSVLSVKRLEQQIMVEIDNALKTAQSAFQRVAATRAAREYAEAALQAEQKKLESGKSTSFQVLQLQKDLTDARGAEIRALADYNNALAQLSLAEGTTLLRHKIDVEVR